MRWDEYFRKRSNTALPFGEACTVIDAQVAKLTDIQYIIAFITICINDAARLYPLANNRQKAAVYVLDTTTV